VIAIRLLIRRLRADRCGATAIEYGLIAALIVISMMVGLKALGGGAGGMWTRVAQEVQNS
jgi:pilus assembly protein Flp/PilA